MLADEIIGKEVIGAQGFKLGKVDDIALDEKIWRVTSLKVKLEKGIAEEYNMRQRFRKSHVLVSVDQVQAVGDRVLLKSSNDEIMKLIASPVSLTSEQPTTTQKTSEDSQLTQHDSVGSN